jgi:iron complex outermembrane receptor protein
MKTILLAFCLSPFLCIAQSQLTGKIIDASSAPIAFANVVVLQSADSSIQKVAVTDDNGQFDIDFTKDGTFFLQVALMGYTPYSSPVFELANNSAKNFNTITLQTSNTLLSEVEVVSTRPLVEVKADKTIFNVDGTTNSTGLNAFELLRRAPGVMVDNNDNVLLKGRSGILIYIDGKRTPLDASGLTDLLKSMQSTSIDRIEIITNPSAKYEAAGNAGIINIVLKKNQNFGTNGNLTLGYATQLYSKYNSNLQLNRRTAKWNNFINYGYNEGNDWSFMNSLRRLNGVQFDQKTSIRSENATHQFKAGTDYYINNNSTVGAIVSGNISQTGMVSESQTDIRTIGLTPLDSTLIASTINDGVRNNINLNVNYHFTDSTKKDLTIDLDYGLFAIQTDGYQPNTYRYGNELLSSTNKNYSNNNSTEISIASLKADYEQPAFTGTLSGGIRLALVTTTNSLDFFKTVNNENLIDSARTNDFTYNEMINAAYLNYNKQIKKIGVQFGVRAEQTISDGQLTSFTSQNDARVERNYINLFPSAALTYSANEKNTFNLTYSRRIDRPSYQDLNPFEFRLDELSYQRGNEFLQPQYTHVVELSHTFMYAMNTSLSFSRTNGFFTEITDTTEFSRSFIQPRNLGYQDYVGVNINTPIPITKWWNAYLGVNLYQLHNVATFDDGQKIDIRVTSYGGYMQQTFTLTKTWSSELSGWYNGPSIWGGTFKNKPMGGIDLAVKKDLWNNQATLRIAYGDLLRTMRWRGISDYAGLFMDVNGGWESRLFRVNFTWKFGNQNIKSKERKIASEDLNKRVK